MKKNYQTTTHRARAGGVARKKAGSSVEAEIVPSSTVEVELDALAEEMREGLLALAVGTGLQVMHALMADEVSAVVGPKGKWNPERTARRHGTDGGEVTLGGRRIGVRKPRVRTADGSAEVSVETYELFSSTELLGRLAMERMLAKLSCRRYRPVWNLWAPRYLLMPGGSPARRSRAGSFTRPRPPWRSSWLGTFRASTSSRS